MSDFKPKSEFRYRFVRRGCTSKSWEVWKDDKEMARIEVAGNITAVPKADYAGIHGIDDWLTEIEHEFWDYMNRPEFIIGELIPGDLLRDEPVTPERQQELKEYYERYIMGCCYAMYEDSTAEQYAARAIKWLSSTDFYVAPASTKYHDDDPSGLLRHTLKVVNNVTELSGVSAYKGVNLAEAVLAAIVHDWCKINFYEQYKRNVKNPDTGKWEEVLAYRHKEPEFPFGHGITSMYMAEKLFKLSAEQALAVRWHMGVYDVSDYQKAELYQATNKYPMVLLLQMADQMSLL